MRQEILIIILPDLPDLAILLVGSQNLHLVMGLAVPVIVPAGIKLLKAGLTLCTEEVDVSGVHMVLQVRLVVRGVCAVRLWAVRLLVLPKVEPVVVCHHGVICFFRLRVCERVRRRRKKNEKITKIVFKIFLKSNNSKNK